MYNSVIRSNDPHAAEMLKENLGIIEGRQKYMQTVNDYYKEHGTTQGCPEVNDEAAAALDSRVNENHTTPYPGRFFTENFSEMYRIKANIDRVVNNPKSLFTGWRFNGGEAVINLANNRLQLLFDEKPSDKQREALKKEGFRWAPSAKVWQLPLSFKAMSAADRLDFIRPENGRKPSELQPKVPKRNQPER